MASDVIIYKGNNSGIGGTITEFDIVGQSRLDDNALGFAVYAIDFSKRIKADLTIIKASSLSAEFKVRLGTIIGSQKRMFTELLYMADDALILPITNDPDFTLRITLSCDDYRCFYPQNFARGIFITKLLLDYGV